MVPEVETVSQLLLRQRGIAVVPTGDGTAPETAIRAAELEFANIGYVFSARLRDRLSRCSLDQIVQFRVWGISTLLAQIGGDQKHEPLFRRFPEGIPDDTEELWWRKVLVHYLQRADQPCLFCRRIGATQVLNPCRHVVCEHCFDGANYSACPVCEHRVDRSSPFFRPSEKSPPSQQTVVFKLIDLAGDSADEARRLFVTLAERTQPLSPDDNAAMRVILREFSTDALAWLPARIPVRENVAVICGTLFQLLDPDQVLPSVRRYLTTATDVLRFIAVLSGADGSLIPETITKVVEREAPDRTYWDAIARLVGGVAPRLAPTKLHVPVRVRRFKVARMPRSLRRTLLALLEGLDQERLTEDMLRHRSYWVWVGEFLHPHEYASRYPNVARAFQIVRKKSDAGVPAPPFQGWSRRVEAALAQRDISQIVSLLSERPGEFARRLDHVLRIAGDSRVELDRIIDAFAAVLAGLPTPILLTLATLLPTRVARAKVRVYWPKGRVAFGASTADDRAVLSDYAVATTVQRIRTELVQRFAQMSHFRDGVIDEQLRTITVPFNERTASQAAVPLPRGSRIPIPTEKMLRLFHHWCQPKGEGNTTDLDLSVALYDATWNLQGACAFYQLKVVNSSGGLVAQSSGDCRDAPWPDGATEFVDLAWDQAQSMGVQYVVMVVNAYAGLPFDLLDRAFAGIMLRDTTSGQHFDPLTVKLKFNLTGSNGVFIPLVLDLGENMMHWLDIHSRGQLEMNSVETSSGVISQICPDLITYFGSDIRASLYDLGLLHAAARCDRVTIRGNGTRQFIRRPDESSIDFLERLRHGIMADQIEFETPTSEPVFALLYQGDMDLPEGSSTFALFHERTGRSLAASDLLT